MPNAYCPTCGGAGRRPGEDRCSTCLGSGKLLSITEGNIASIYKGLTVLEADVSLQDFAPPPQEPQPAQNPPAAPPPPQPPAQQPQAAQAPRQLGWLNGAATPSACLGTDDKTPALTMAWLETDASPRWEGPYIFATDSAVLVAAKVIGNAGSRPDVDDGPIGVKALKLVERSRRFDATPTRVEPFAAKGEERLVIMRPDDPGGSPDWGQVAPVQATPMKVRLSVSHLLRIIKAVGAEASDDVVLSFDMAGVDAEGSYLRPVVVNDFSGKTVADGLIMPKKQK